MPGELRVLQRPAGLLMLAEFFGMRCFPGRFKDKVEVTVQAYCRDDRCMSLISVDDKLMGVLPGEWRFQFGMPSPIEDVAYRETVVD